MSLYDPNALPPWEIERGAGPITKQEKLRKCTSLRGHLYDLTLETQLARTESNKPAYTRLSEEQAFVRDTLAQEEDL